jgi:hypothetical protein
LGGIRGGSSGVNDTSSAGLPWGTSGRDFAHGLVFSAIESR